MKVLTVATMKGGVGKTATAHALGEALSQMGRRVLLVDIDPQSSLTSAAGVSAADQHIGNALDKPKETAAAIVSLSPTLSLLPSDIALATVELRLVVEPARETRLKRALAAVADEFDIAIVDTPPSLGLLTVNALTAADMVLITTQPQAADLRGLKLFLGTLNTIKEHLNPSLETFGVLVTFYDTRLLHHRGALEAMAVGELPLLETKIGRSVRIAEAMAAGESIITHEPNHPQTQAYRDVATKVNEWLNDAKGM